MNQRNIYKAVGTIIGVSIAVNTIMHNNALSKEIKQEMLNICGTDSNCIKAVDSSFDNCLNRSTKNDLIDVSKIGTCINSYAGENYFTSKEALSKDTKQEMLNVCSTDSNCIEAVNSSFDDCFNSSMLTDTLDVDLLADCVNLYAGEDYFVYEYN